MFGSEVIMPDTVFPRPHLTPMPVRLRKLRVDHRGYPVPAFVQWCQTGRDTFEPATPGAPDAYPEFRVMNQEFWVRAVKQKLCWVCGEPLGVYKTFVIGPMCAVNRTSSEPPCHLDCAVWSAVNCPFLSRPHMVRREDERTDPLVGNVAGIMIARNPGVTLLWTTRVYTVFAASPGKLLLTIGEPTAVAWYAHGRTATRAEVIASIESGVPLLEATIEQEEVEDRPAAREELRRRMEAVTELLPA